MIKIEDIEVGKSYACKFKVETMLDIFGRVPGLSDTPLKGPGMYEGVGVIQVRDTAGKRVQLKTQVWEIMPINKIGKRFRPEVNFKKKVVPATKSSFDLDKFDD